MTSVRELLHENRDFRRLFLAAVVSMAGDWFAFVALAELLTSLTGSAGAPAFVFAATVLPMFFASPFSGWAADRFDRKRLLVSADTARVPLALLLCVAAWTGSPVLALGATVGLGIAASFHDPVINAVVPNLVRGKQLAQAQALIGAVWGSMLMLGAGLGGIVAELLGVQAAFAINAASFAVSGLLIASIEAPMQQADEAQRAAQSGGVKDALRFIVRDRLVRRLILAKLGVSSANGTVGLLPAIAAERFGGTTIATGLLFAARGLGAMLGPMLARWMGGHTPSMRFVVGICGTGTLLYLCVYALVPLVPVFGLAMVMVVIAHVGGGAQWGMSTYGLQVSTPDAVRGRVLALDYGLATLVIGSSALVAGFIADRSGTDAATWMLVSMGAVYGVFWTLWALAGVRRV